MIRHWYKGEYEQMKILYEEDRVSILYDSCFFWKSFFDEEDDGKLTMYGDLATVMGLEDNHSVEKHMKRFVSSKDVEYDSESGTFFAYSSNIDELIKMLKVAYPNISDSDSSKLKADLQTILNETIESFRARKWRG